MLKKAEALQDTLIKLRRTIHMHPEFGFEELQTSALVAETLGDNEPPAKSQTQSTGRSKTEEMI